MTGLIGKVNRFKRIQREKRDRRSKIPGTQYELPTPQPKQQQFLDSPAKVALYGGAAGSGKTLAMLLDAVKYRDLAGYSAVFLRRTSPQIHNEGGLWDESSKIYPLLSAEPITYRSEWRFPTGSTIRFTHCQHEKNKYDWQGAQIPRLYFDELTHFTSEQFFYLLSRLRTTLPITPQLRASCNPDADSWVKSLVEWYLQPDGFPDPSKSGIIRYFVRFQGELHWGDTEEELRDRFPDIDPISFTFIFATIYDNPALLRADPGYLANLQAQHPVEKMRLLGGNWNARLEAGKVFDRSWFEVVDASPDGGYVCRFWDLAATEKAIKGNDPCYTAGVKIKKVQGVYYVLDVIAERLSPAKVDNLIQRTAQQDGHGCLVRWEREPGSAGVRDASHIATLLDGFDARAIIPREDKVMRAKPFATQAAHGNVKLIRAGWNDRYLNWLSSFPDGAKDPIDASSGAYSVLVNVGDEGGWF